MTNAALDTTLSEIPRFTEQIVDREA